MTAPAEPASVSPALSGNTLQDISSLLQRARAEAGKAIFGQDEVLDRIFVTLIAGGHVLLIGAPGLAKTMMVDTVARTLGLASARIQCTPDLMPADILGSEVLEQGADGKRSFRFIEGPVFTQFLMADEINRASPRTQSALLQAMQERTVTAGGTVRSLPRPFHVLATQNPLEQEGTYPLPEAQLDRFLMQIDVSYPGREAERDIILSAAAEAPAIQAVFAPGDLEAAQDFVRHIPIGESVVDAILELVRRSRPGPEALPEAAKYIVWPPGPRASQALALACRAKALLDGRGTPSVDDVIDLAAPVLKHRMALNYQAKSDGIGLGDIIGKLTHGL